MLRFASNPKRKKEKKKKAFLSAPGIAGGSINDGLVRGLVFMLRSVGLVPVLTLLYFFVFI